MTYSARCAKHNGPRPKSFSFRFTTKWCGQKVQMESDESEFLHAVALFNQFGNRSVDAAT